MKNRNVWHTESLLSFSKSVMPILVSVLIVWLCVLSEPSYAVDTVKAGRYTERYTLIMSKDDDLCTHMLKLFNQDLKKYGWKGDEHQEEHEEFKRIPWRSARFSFDPHNPNGKLEYQSVEGALFDFNNDGIEDFVVRYSGTVNGIRVDSLSIFDREVAGRANELTSREFWDAKNHIYLAGLGYKLPSMTDGLVIPQVLEPFIYRGTSYLVMRELFEELRTMSGYAVIAKYGEGRFVSREPLGRMEDICYFKRIGAKRILH